MIKAVTLWPPFRFIGPLIVLMIPLIAMLTQQIGLAEAMAFVVTPVIMIALCPPSSMSLTIAALFLATAASTVIGASHLALVVGDGFIGCLAAALPFLPSKERNTKTAGLRILLVTRHDPVRVGGTETYLKNFLRRIAEECVGTVRFVTFDQGIQMPTFGNTSFYARAGGPVFRYLRSHEAQALEPSPRSAVLLLLVAFELARIAVSAARGEEYDVVYGVGGPIAALAAVITARWLGKTAVAHFHYDYRFSTYSPIAQRLIRRTLMSCAAIVANGAGSTEDLAAIGYPRERCYTVLNWLSDEDIVPETPRNAQKEPGTGTTFLYVGRLVPEKGVQLILDAFRLLDTTYQLVIAGDGPLRDEVALRVSSSDNIKWLGEVPHDRIKTVYAEVDVVVWASIDIHYLSYVGIEALANGIPVIASRRGTTIYTGAPTVAPETLPSSVGILAEPTAADIARACMEIATWDRAKTADACRAFVRRFYSARNFDTLMQALQSARHA